jgi:hypothetical protein
MNDIRETIRDVIVYEQQYRNDSILDLTKRIFALQEKKLGIDMTIVYLKKKINNYPNRDKDTLEEIFCSYNNCIETSVLDSLYDELTNNKPILEN